MKRNKLVTIVLIVFTSCSAKNSDFDWLVGSWVRTNGKPGTETNESWVKIDDVTYKGTSLILKDEEIIYEEHCTIKKEENVYYYIAVVPQNPNPTRFKIVAFSDHSFKAINTEHDFPKEINYTVSGKTILASISGSEKRIDYIFKKSK